MKKCTDEDLEKENAERAKTWIIYPFCLLFHPTVYKSLYSLEKHRNTVAKLLCQLEKKHAHLSIAICSAVCLLCFSLI